MARANSRILDNGDMLPDLVLATVDGGQVKLPRDFNGQWGILLLYRGDW